MMVMFVWFDNNSEIKSLNITIIICVFFYLNNSYLEFTKCFYYSQNVFSYNSTIYRVKFIKVNRVIPCLSFSGHSIKYQ